MSVNYIDIPGRLRSVALDGQVAGANQVYDDDRNMFQSVINELMNAHMNDASIHFNPDEKQNIDNIGKLISIVGLSAFTCSSEKITNPEWEYVILDASSHILAGIRRDSEIVINADLDEILTYVTPPNYGLIDVHDDLIDVSSGLSNVRLSLYDVSSGLMDVSTGLYSHINDSSIHLSEDDILKLSYICTFSTLNGSFEQNPEWKQVILDASNHILAGVNNDNKAYLYASIDEIFNIIEAPKYSLVNHVEDSSIHVTQDERTAWNGKQDPASTLAGYGITDAKIENGTVKLGSNQITPLTSHQSVTDNNPTLSWGTQSKVATIGNTDIHVKLPANPNTDTKNTAGSTNNTNKLFLIGAQTQEANPQTYSRVNCYIDASGYVFSGGSRTMTFDDTLTADQIGIVTAIALLDESAGDVSVVTNPEYKWVVLDASSHILMGYKTDGSFYFAGVDALTSYSGQKSGTFANRPTYPYVGQQYFCTDKTATGGSNAGIPIWYNGTGWVDAIGTTIS